MMVMSPVVPPTASLDTPFLVVQLSQELWAVDLDLGYSDHLALQQLLSYVTGLRGDWGRGQLALPEGGARWAILTPHLQHTNLSVVQYPIFFQMCRAHHIGYDPNVS